jgi:hypothetical protein
MTTNLNAALQELQQAMSTNAPAPTVIDADAMSKA